MRFEPTIFFVFVFWSSRIMALASDCVLWSPFNLFDGLINLVTFQHYVYKQCSLVSISGTRFSL